MATVGPVLGAALVGDLRALRAAIRNGGDVDERDPIFARTPLIAAVTLVEGPVALDIARVLLEAGAPVDSVDRDKSTALTCAVIQGKGGFVDWLLERGASVALEDRHGLRAVDHAVLRDKTGRITQLLLDAGADPRLKSGRGTSAWEVAKLHQSHGFRVAALPVLEAWMNRAK